MSLPCSLHLFFVVLSSWLAVCHIRCIVLLWSMYHLSVEISYALPLHFTNFLLYQCYVLFLDILFNVSMLISDKYRLDNSWSSLTVDLLDVLEIQDKGSVLLVFFVPWYIKTGDLKNNSVAVVVWWDSLSSVVLLFFLVFVPYCLHWYQRHIFCTSLLPLGCVTFDPKLMVFIPTNCTAFSVIADSYNFQLINHVIGEVDLGIDVSGDVNWSQCPSKFIWL